MDFNEALNKLDEAWNLPKEEIEAALPLMQEIVDAVPEINGHKMKLDTENLGTFEKETNKDGTELWSVPTVIDDTLYDAANWEGDEYGEFDPHNCAIESDRLPEGIIKDEFVKPLTPQLPIEKDKFVIVGIQVDDSDGYECLPDEDKNYKETRKDAGIGSYEYWGFQGYDSSPYTEFEGTAKYEGGKVFLSIFAKLKK